MLKSPFFMSASCEQALRLRDVGISHARTAVGRRCFAMGSRVFPRLALLATQNGESTQRRHVFRVCVFFFFLFCYSIQIGTGTSSRVNLPRSDTKSSNLFTKGQPCYKSTSYNFLKPASMRSRQSERRTREVDLFRLSGFESYYKINSREKKQIRASFQSFSGYVILKPSVSYWSIVITSLVKFLISEFAQTGMKSPLK